MCSQCWILIIFSGLDFCGLGRRGGYPPVPPPKFNTVSSSSHSWSVFSVILCVIQLVLNINILLCILYIIYSSYMKPSKIVRINNFLWMLIVWSAFLWQLKRRVLIWTKFYYCYKLSKWFSRIDWGCYGTSSKRQLRIMSIIYWPV